jgi:hypothetical protein
LTFGARNRQFFVRANDADRKPVMQRFGQLDLFRQVFWIE